MPVSSGLTNLSLPHHLEKPSAFRRKGHAIYYTHELPGYEFDQRVVDRFRKEIDPYFIPLCVKTVYESPAHTEMIFIRHAIGIAAGDNPPFKRMADFKFCQVHNPVVVDRKMLGEPHHVLEILEGPHPTWWPQELPGPFYPISEMHLKKYKALNYWGRHVSKEEEGKQYVEYEKARLEGIHKYYREEMDYRWNHDWRYMMKTVQGLDATELGFLLDGRPVMN